MLKAVGYARISKDDTLEGRGVARQTEDIAAVCERQGWELVEVLTDNDISASRYSKKPRPGYGRLLAAIEAGIDRAVVYDVDRLLRQPRQLEDLIDLCEQRNGAFQLHNVNGELDLATGGGRFIARMLVAKAAMESDDLSRRLRRAFDQKALEGRPHGGRAFGYEPDGMTVRESEAALLRQAAMDVLDGAASLNEIARRWNALGVLTPQRSRPWNGTVVKAVLTNPRQAGLRVHRREVIGPAAWPAVLDRATHERLVAVLTAPRPRNPPRRTPFTGLIRSAVTGLPLDRDVVRRWVCYRAHNRPGREAGNVTIAAEALEALILSMLFTAVEDDRLGERLGRRRRRSLPRRTCRGSRTTSGRWPKTSVKAGSPGPSGSPLEARSRPASTPPTRPSGRPPPPRYRVNLRESWPTLVRRPAAGHPGGRVRDGADPPVDAARRPGAHGRGDRAP